MATIKERVDRLEKLMAELIKTQQKTELELQRLSIELQRLSIELQRLTIELQRLSKEMIEFKEENRKQNKDMNKKWGELANKLGTIVEDIIAPAVSPVIKQYFNCEVNDLQVNRKKKDIKTGLKDEFDVIAVSDDCKTVFLVEVKSTPKIDYINEFKDKKIDRFLTLFPEYREYKLIPIFASLRLEEDIVNYLTKQKIYAMAYKEWEYMDILNFDKIDKNN
ncbi:hypothetical protein JCM14244_11340 [Venenivibrio stagnispumantis]|uniref:DUF3782 domain-containing protein n=1 Tax=Venenivibrio stagnispumantis TaxID=407998 RepID=A0AA45WNB3_9AQUI|nr:hypothetical protein [Venenivibrio stagnispumantis]MCW4573197.1 hypothetical protein [Venenivibrio stagnispumantis]SMP17577.1 hypothetical protein SAMN06264868_11622 [Venenivibrio stagnispumantis]